MLQQYAIFEKSSNRRLSMRTFFLRGKPVSQNNRGSAKIVAYRLALQSKMNAIYGAGSHMFNVTDDLYGLVYYFRKRIFGFDADNVSKPLWDALESVCYVNDKVIKLRLAGVITQDYHQNYIIPTIGLSTAEQQEIINFFNDPNENHMIYVVLDKIIPTHYKYKI
jgi:hypothetical protein